MKALILYLLLCVTPVLMSQKPDLLPDTIRICQGDSVLLDIRQSYDNFTSVYWITPSGIITNTSRLTAIKPGKYKVRVESAYFSKQIQDSVFVQVLARPQKHLKDTVLCSNNSLLIRTQYPGDYHLWNTGANSPSLQISKPGLYWVKISNGVCSLTDTFVVKSITGTKSLLPEEIGFCLNEQRKLLSVKINSGAKLLWSTGSVSYSTAVNSEGLYWVQVSQAPCRAFRDSVRVFFKACECEMMVPNSFTPNEDGRNDYFFPVTECDYSYYNMNISDRWGNTIFTTVQSNGKWDGRFKGNLCPEDIYVYKIETIERGTDKKQVRTGHVSLFR